MMLLGQLCKPYRYVLVNDTDMFQFVFLFQLWLSEYCSEYFHFHIYLQFLVFSK